MATIKDIAEMAGVSITTVSRILNNDSSLSTTMETKQKVIDAAKKLNYKKVGRSTKATFRLGIVQWFSAEQELQDTYYLSVRNGIEDFCIKNCIQIVRAFKTDVNYMDYLENINGLICIGKFSKKEVKELKSENESLKSKLAKDALGDVMDQVEEVKGVKVLATSLEDVDMNGLRELGDNLKEKLGEGVIVLASQKDGKVFLVAMVTDEAQKAGAHAGNLIKAIAGCVGGGGGGRPNMAQAGGKNPAGIPEAVAKVKEILESQIS